MRRYLQKSVARRRQIRILKSLALASVASVFIALFTVILLDDTNLERDLRLVEIGNQTSAPPTLTVVSNTPIIEYVIDIPAIEIIPTRSLTVTPVNDRELEEVFFERAYAILEDENSNISAFHLLDAQYVEDAL